MTIAFLAVVLSLIVLAWSADRFVTSSALVARYFNMPPLLIGMVIIGFGTSAPEIVVSTLAASQGNPSIALGNAYVFAAPRIESTNDSKALSRFCHVMNSGDAAESAFFRSI